VEKKTLIDEYFEYQEFYENKYGKNTMVLMELGSFYEVYQVINDKENIGKAKEIADILNIQLTKKNKKIESIDRKNPYMAGIPSISLDKHMAVLIKENKYTLVKVDQITEPPNVIREVTEVISPGTNISNLKVTNKLMNCYIENLKNGNLGIGITTINVSTGKNEIFETISTKDNKKKPEEDLKRFLVKENPNEVSITFKDFTLEEENIFIKKNNLSDYNLQIQNIEKDKYKISYINEVFSKIYNNQTMLTGIENINLELMSFATFSLMGMVIFLNEHNQVLLRKIEKPKKIEEEGILKLTNNSIYQLNIINNKIVSLNEGSLYQILNKTKTLMGGRLLKDRLLTPITNKKKINERYRKIELYKENNRYKEIRKELTEIIDIERLIRKVGMGIINPAELFQIYNSLLQINNIFEIDYIERIEKIKTIKKEVNSIIESIESKYIITEILKYNLNDIGGNIYKKGIYSNIDKIINKKEEKEKSLNEELIKFKNTYKVEAKMEKTDKEGYFITLSNTRAKEIKIDKEEYSKKVFSNKVKIYNEVINNISEEILIINQEIVRENKKQFLFDMDYFYDVYNEYLEEIIRVISDIDVSTNNTYIAETNRYYKPIIVENNEAFFNGKNIRHPLVEKLTETEYITNDIQLDKDKQGKLIFGVNATGKSTILKAVGLNIIMAQAGMFVPGKIEYTPFKSIFTRITGEDNIFKNQSTFTVEMLELKSILEQSNKDSLILADELSHGTETNSGVAILATSVQHMTKNNSKFLLTTHLHQLNDIKDVKENKKVDFNHLSVEYCEERGIIYERKLKEGSGNSIYGLVVAKGLGLKEDFINDAKKILSQIKDKDSIEEIIESKKNKYNKKKNK
jgi:DNA mismatch repair protein MutS